MYKSNHKEEIRFIILFLEGGGGHDDAHTLGAQSLRIWFNYHFQVVVNTWKAHLYFLCDF